MSRSHAGVGVLAGLLACGPGSPTPAAGSSSSGGEGSEDVGDSSASETGPPVDPDCPDLVLEGNLLVDGTTDVAEIPAFTSVNGSVNVLDSSVKDVSFLRCLREVQGSLIIGSNHALRSLEGLEKLQRVGVLRVTGNPVLESLDALDSLHTIEGYGLVDKNEGMVRLGLPALVRVRTLEVGADCAEGLTNAALTEIGGLDSLAEFDLLFFAYNPALQQLDALEGLAERIGTPQPDLYYNVFFGGNETLSFAHIVDVLGEGDATGALHLRTCGHDGDDACQECIWDE